MPRCIACNTLLPSKVFPEDGEIRKCVFCIRGQDTFEHGNIDEGFEIYNRKKMEKEYIEYLQEISRKPNIARILIECEKENDG
jgi:radical SAM protein with 4Fe4S-binding SPASM domain